MDSKENKKEEEYRNDEDEYEFKDTSEDLQWEKHYYDRNKKWRFNYDSEGVEF